MIQDNQFDEKLLEQIKEEKISPKPRWKFIAKNSVFWILGASCLFLGSIAVSLAMHMLRSNDWSIYERIHKGAPKFLLLAIPFFWLACLIVFIVFVFYNFKNTKKGYRYSALLILLAAAAGSAVLGGAFYFMGMGEKIDDVLSQNAPFYDRVINPRVRFWFNPEEGRLAGLIVAQIAEDEFIVIDQLKHEWTVSAQGAKRPPENMIIIGKPARFLGQKISDNEFKAEEILPMMRAGRKFFNRFGLPHMPPANMQCR